MGTIFAKIQATLSIGYFEMKLYSACIFKYREVLAEHIREDWNRFSDDCYTNLSCSQIIPEKLLLTLNPINLSIQNIVWNIVRTKYHFQIFQEKRNGYDIWMNLYHKPTDTQKFLPFTSSHPNHCKRNILFCLAQRICAIAENNAEKLKKGRLSQYHKNTYQNLKNHQIKTSCHSLQHLIQIT